MYYLINCNNHTCELRDACRNYINESVEETYLRPMITFDSAKGKKIFQCDYLVPHNIESITRRINSDNRIRARKIKLAYEILEQLAPYVNKQKLLKDLNSLID